MGALPSAKVSVEEYLALDRAAEVKSEYRDGEMFPMEGVSWQHSIIGFKIGAWLIRQLHQTSCNVAGSSLRVRVSPTKFVIPDIVVVCGKPVLTDEVEDTVINPKVVIEILSPSTADYDCGGKFLVSQDRARVETYRKTSDKRWVLNIHEGLDSVAAIDSLNVSLPLAEVYDGVELPAAVED